VKQFSLNQSGLTNLNQEDDGEDEGGNDEWNKYTDKHDQQYEIVRVGLGPTAALVWRILRVARGRRVIDQPGIVRLTVVRYNHPISTHALQQKSPTHSRLLVSRSIRPVPWAGNEMGGGCFL